MIMGEASVRAPSVTRDLPLLHHMLLTRTRIFRRINENAAIN
jgi:hypothetical protein